MSKQQTLSVIVPTYKRKADLQRLLKSIAESDYPARLLEVVVVDNAGDLTEQDLLPSIGDIKLKLVKPDKNLYCSGGRLYGTKYAEGDYYFFIDDDNILDKKCLSELAKGFSTIPNLAVAAPLMLVYKDKERIWTAGVRLNKLVQPIYLHGQELLSQVELPDVIMTMDAFPNAFMVKQEALETVPFDVDNFPHNWSEADFGMRIKQHGYATATITTARDWHDIDYGGQLTRTDRVKVYDQAKSRVLFRKRFFSSFFNWLTFWCLTFPVSTLFYLKAIFSSPDKHKSAMIGRYFKGTFDGFVTPLK